MSWLMMSSPKERPNFLWSCALSFDHHSPVGHSKLILRVALADVSHNAASHHPLRLLTRPVLCQLAVNRALQRCTRCAGPIPKLGRGEHHSTDSNQRWLITMSPQKYVRIWNGQPFPPKVLVSLCLALRHGQDRVQEQAQLGPWPATMTFILGAPPIWLNVFKRQSPQSSSSISMLESSFSSMLANSCNVSL